MALSQVQESPQYYDWRLKMTRAAMAINRTRETIYSWFTRSRVPEAITSLICLGLLVLSATMILDADRYMASPTFHDALGPGGVATPEVWGVLLSIPCAATLLSLLARRRDVYWPLAAIVAWMTAFSYFVAKSANNDGSVSSPVTIYVTLSLVLTLLAIMYAGESDRP